MSPAHRSPASSFAVVMALTLPALLNLSARAQSEASCRRGMVFSFNPVSIEPKEIKAVRYPTAGGHEGTIEADSNQIVFVVPSDKLEPLKTFVADHAGCNAVVRFDGVKLETESIEGLFGGAAFVGQSRFFNAIVPKSRMGIDDIRKLVKADGTVTVTID